MVVSLSPPQWCVPRCTKETLPFCQMVVNDMFQLFFTHRLHLNRFFPTPKWPFLANKEVTAPCWRKRRGVPQLVEFTPASPTWSVRRAFASWLRQLGVWHQWGGQGIFLGQHKMTIWSKNIQIQRKTFLPQFKPPRRFFRKKKIFNPP